MYKEEFDKDRGPGIHSSFSVCDVLLLTMNPNAVVVPRALGVMYTPSIVPL